jgi:hypothetical protein
MYGSIFGRIWFGSDHNGIGTSTRKLEWHIFKSCFYNGIFLSGESCNSMDPINP